MRLSRMFLVGAREDVRLDVHIERRVVKLPPIFFVFGKELPNRCVVVLTFVFAGKMGWRVDRLSHVFLGGAGKELRVDVRRERRVG